MIAAVQHILLLLYDILEHRQDGCTIKVKFLHYHLHPDARVPRSVEISPTFLEFIEETYVSFLGIVDLLAFRLQGNHGPLGGHDILVRRSVVKSLTSSLQLLVNNSKWLLGVNCDTNSSNPS